MEKKLGPWVAYMGGWRRGVLLPIVILCDDGPVRSVGGRDTCSEQSRPCRSDRTREIIAYQTGKGKKLSELGEVTCIEMSFLILICGAIAQFM